MKRLSKSLVLALVMLALGVALIGASLPTYCAYCHDEFNESSVVNYLPDNTVVHSECYTSYLVLYYNGTPPPPWGYGYDPSDVPWGG